MNFIDDIISSAKGDYIKYHKMDALIFNFSYEVQEFKFIDVSPGGQALLCTLQNPLTQEEITIWLPDRIAKRVKTAEDLKKLNDASFNLKFMGRNVNKFNMAIFELIPATEIDSQEKLLK